APADSEVSSTAPAANSHAKAEVLHADILTPVIPPPISPVDIARAEQTAPPDHLTPTIVEFLPQLDPLLTALDPILTATVAQSTALARWQGCVNCILNQPISDASTKLVDASVLRNIATIGTVAHTI